MITILLLILIVGVVLAIFDIDERFKKLAFIVIAVVVIVWLLQVFGLAGALAIPHLR